MGDINGSVDPSGMMYEPLAIVGMGMRLPGGIHTAEDLWSLLVEKRTTRCEVPSDRFNISAFYSPSGRVGSVKMQHGHFLAPADDLQHLDASFFSMSRKEVEILDPQQRMLLEVVYECMQNAGQSNWRGGNIGCYVGVWGEDWVDIHAKDSQDSGMYRIAGGQDFAISNRISYEYDLKGPSFTIKSGCSSSMIGLHEAVRAIQAGDCTSAIVAGANLILSPTMSIAMTEQGVLSPDGACKSFDISADGYARGEAINAIYIKRLSDALHDGDKIRSVIRATASNCDGKTPGMTLPSSESHESMMRRAYKEAYLDPTETAFVEAHGTGTNVGDPLETTAIARVFGSEKGVYIGSVKPNLGHSEGASGVTSILKTVLALENNTIPPNINFSTPNPKIPFEMGNMTVPIEPTPWPKLQAERASVNSFGIGGANAHVILDSPASLGIGNVKTHSTNGLSNGDLINGHSVNGTSMNGHSTNGYSTNSHSANGHSANGHSTNGTSINGHSKPRPSLLVLSATNTDSLRANVVKHQQYVDANPEKLKDIEYNLCNRREHLSHRAFCVTDGLSTLEFSPLNKPKKTPTVVMVFTGQGAQWAEMGKELIEDFASFSQDIDSMNDALTKLDHPPPWNIKEELMKHNSLSCLSKAEYAQPLVTAVQVALVNLLSRFGVKPAAVVGHSSGEIAAAYASNAITASEAIIIAYYRGQVTKGFSRRGGMAAVGLGREDVLPFLIPGVGIACENSPSSVTLSGDEDALDAACQNIKTELPDVFLRRLKVEMAYHSHHMRELGEAYEALLQPHLKSTAPDVPFFSSVVGKVLTESEKFGPAYWRANLENSVLFNSAIKLILDTQSQDHLFLEIGPHSALAGPLRQILKANSRKNDTYVTALERGKDCHESVLKMVGELFLQNIHINFKQVAPSGTVLSDLPLYQWCHDQEYWNESRVSREWRLRKHANHEILGCRTVEGNDLQPEWRNVLRLDNVPWLRDHQIINDIVFPCAGYLSMACEAIRQISGAEDFTFRNVLIQTALVLSDSKSVEMITSLRPVRLTNTLNSVWWEFSISSFNGSIWMKHCSGQIRAGTDNPKVKLPHRIEDHPRVVPLPYPAMKKVGLNYGPAFQGLEKLSALPKKMTASATLSKPEPSESHYAIHPTTIDHCLQLFIISTCEGTLRNINKLCVPTCIDQLYIRGGKATNGVKAEAVGSQNSSGTISGDVLAVSDDQIILSLVGGQFSPIEENSSDETPDTIAGARLDWRPDLDFVEINSLIRPQQQSTAATKSLERLTILSIIEIGRRISGLVAKSEYLEKFRSWINAQIQRASENKYDLVEDAQSLLAFSSEERQRLITELSKDISNSEVAASEVLISRVLKNCEDIMEGKVDGIEVLLPENALTHFYDSLESRTDCIDFFTAAGHSKPNLRVLEIGSGTGGTSAVVLRGLTSTTDRMYSTYTYTDISSGFFVEAQERFKDYQGLEYKVLDISKDPTEQGFQDGSYNLIIAANVLHATPSLNTTLTHVRKLLAEDGRLFLQELSPQVQFANLIMGVLPGWWLGEADGRTNEPYISPQRWDMELKKAGLSGLDATIYDAEQPYQFNANIISRPSRVDHVAQRITLLYEQDSGIEGIKASLANKGYSVDLCTIKETPPAGQDIISLLEIEKPMFEKISDEDLVLFQNLVRNLGTNQLLWVTRSAQTESYDPRFGMVLGIARTLRSELSISIATLEIDAVDEVAYTAITNVFGKLKDSSSKPDINPDYEFVLSKKVINVGRYHPVSVEQELAVSASQSQAVKLEIGRFGLLQTLRWVPYLQSKLGRDQIIVEPRCAGLNFKDVLVSMGIVNGDSLGLEGSGVVVEVGSDVTDFQAGDRVLYIDQNCFSTRTTISAQRCAKIPPTLSWEEAATMPCVYATVIHSLLNLRRLQKGQSVLIHSACGGIGLAAIQICQNIVGAEIYVTVGNEEKVQYLMETFGISRDHIFNSRDTSFLPAIKTATNGRGVDLVLNSLSGELLHASWECVAEYGSMVEIGKRDFIGKAQLNMDLFESNRSFFGVDLAKFDDARCQLLLAQIVEFYKEGLIKAIAPVKIFEGSKVEDSFRYMQKGSHIGKIVVTIPERNTELPLAHIVPELKLNPDASYLLVGGLGGLGRSISTWMIEKGARHLIFLSRSAGKSDQDQSFFRELESQDCTVQAFAGSVTTLEDVQNAVKGASKPIKGVFQMSMVLRDKPFLEMSLSDWETSVLPKVEGTWNLHHTLPKDLDFFIATSSLSGSFGNAGQANYAAANTFLDAFVQYRHSLGLPASVVDIGVMGDIGYVSQNTAIQDSLRAAGTYFLQEQDFLDSLNWAVAKSPVEQSLPGKNQLLIGVRSNKPLSDPSNRVSWKRDARMGAYLNTGSAASANNSSATDQLKSFMSSVETDFSILNSPASLDLVTNEIGIRIYTFMLQPIEELDVSQSLAALGVDSLVTIEIRNWMKRSFGGLEFSTLEILNAGTIEALGLLTIEGLKRKFEVGDGDSKLRETGDTYLLMKAP